MLRLTTFATAIAMTVVLCAPAAAEPRHQAWDQLLSRYVTDGLVDYQGLARERSLLDAYLGDLAASSADELAALTRNEQMAFWINAYNAYTVSLILDHYPLESIWKITPFWQRISGGPFALEFIPLGHLLPGSASKAGGKIALQTIEHQILREFFHEPRIHFAIVCASLGCPILRSQAYEGAELNSQLDDAAETFMRSNAKNHYDATRHALQVSPIFKWFSDDFAVAGGPVGYFIRYGNDAAAAVLASHDDPPALSYSDYDWSLNIQPN